MADERDERSAVLHGRGRRPPTSSRAAARRASTHLAPSGAGSRTQTLTLTPSGAGATSSTDATARGEDATEEGATLCLRLVRRRRVQWTEDTHDNEHDNKRSSKSCCIFHKSRAFDESSTESDNDASSSSSGGQRSYDRSVERRHELHKLREATGASESCKS